MDFTEDKNSHVHQFSWMERELKKVSEDKLTDRILILGSGVLECQTAIALAKEGKEVVIIERSDELLPDCLNSPIRAQLMRSLEKWMVTFYLETSIMNSENGQVCLGTKEGFQLYLDIDNIIAPKGYEYF
ncbi:FAD-dependent oxidoreductase [Enterococcus rotai]|uniref:FAD-dependent oxidoreductase n=1 Tax=Enterococcus rotai TaxID=118060 RepID=UPI0032B60812